MTVKTKSFHPLVLFFAYATVKHETRVYGMHVHMVCLSVYSFSETMEFAVIKNFRKALTYQLSFVNFKAKCLWLMLLFTISEASWPLFFRQSNPLMRPYDSSDTITPF